jgi:hypothetical protein
MMVETGLERLSMLNDFGVNVTVNGSTIKGIFDSPYGPVEVGGEVAFSIQESSVLVRTSDIPTVVQGTTMVVDGRSYVITDIQPDGTGMTTLMLEAQ